MAPWSLGKVKLEQGSLVDAMTCQSTSSFRTEKLSPPVAGAQRPLWEYSAEEIFTEACIMGSKALSPSRSTLLWSSLEANWDLSWVCITAQRHPLHNPCPSLPQLLIPRALLINVLPANFNSRFHFPGNSTAKGSDQVTFREDML